MTTPARLCSIADCGRPHKGHGYCSSHLVRLRKHGDPHGGRSKRANGEWRAFLERAANAETDKCIEGGGGTRPSIRIHPGRGMHASRYVWIVAHGDPGDLLVLHTCDNALCVNVRHLYLGDHLRNVLDIWERDRMPARNIARGERTAKAKLTVDEVREIRRRFAAGETQSCLGPEYGVSQVAVSAIVRRKSWAHIEDQK